MSKRRAGHTDPRAPVLAALDHEYVRAMQAKDTERAQKVLAMILALQPGYAPVGPGEAIQRDLPQAAVLQPEPAFALTEPGFARPEPVQPVEMEPQHGDDPLDLPRIVVPEPAQSGPMAELERKKAAMERINTAKLDEARKLAGSQLEYEQALMVLNGSAEAYHDLEQAALTAGMGVVDYARVKVDGRTAAMRRDAQNDAVMQQAFNAIDTASGDRIDEIATEAIALIRGA